MNDERLIELRLDEENGCYLVSSDQFPLLNLVISDNSVAEIEKSVLPVLKEMVEFRVQEPVELRVVSPFDGRPGQMPLPHVIASRTKVTHVA